MRKAPDAVELTKQLVRMNTINPPGREEARELGPEVELETLMDLEAVYTDPQDPWMQSGFEVMGPMLRERPTPRVATYFTDAAALNQAYSDPPTVILGPGEPQMAHQTDEYCLLERVQRSVAGYEEIIRRWCLT